MSFQDTFQTTQDYSFTPTLAYSSLSQGGWFPASSRTMASEDLRTFIIGAGNLELVPGPTISSGSLTYNFTQPQDFTSLGSIAFDSVQQITSTFSNSLTIDVYVNTSPLPVGTVTVTDILGPTDIPPIDVTIDSSFVSSLTFVFTVERQGTGNFIMVIDHGFTSTYSCLAEGSKILTKEGWKAVELLQRGENIHTSQGFLPLARLIKKEVSPRQQVEMVVFSPGSLGAGLPREQTIICGEHYLLYQGKRYVAKSFLPFPGVKLEKTRAAQILPRQGEKYYLYDLQFEVESDYLVNGLTSQSRSPYARASPLPRELYFDSTKYREIRVPNTLREDPPISWAYLFPDGREIKSSRQ